MAFAVRDFISEDFEILWRMDQECFPPGIAYSKRELTSYIRHPKSFTLLAINETSSDKANSKVIQGFIVGHKGGIGHIITIDVSPAARRDGVGSLLLRAAEQRLQATGSTAVGLETAVDNLGALAFYRRNGYRVLRTWPRYYPNGVDALVLHKPLA